jgi:hypothetical protein
LTLCDWLETGSGLSEHSRNALLLDNPYDSDILQFLSVNYCYKFIVYYFCGSFIIRTKKTDHWLGSIH